MKKEVDFSNVIRNPYIDKNLKRQINVILNRLYYFCLFYKNINLFINTLVFTHLHQLVVSYNPQFV